jgi:hypothetical protein
VSTQNFAAAAKKFSVRRAWLCAAPFILMGLVALGLALYGLFTRQLNFVAGKHLLTVMVVCTGIPLLIVGWFASKRPKAEVWLKAEHPDEPWRWRPDWVAGRVDNAVRRSVFFVWIAVIVFNLMCLLAVVVVLHGVRYGSSGAWLALVFPAAGLAVLVFAAKTTRTWRRFGRAVLALTALPVAPGGVVAGEVRVPVRLRPVPAFYLRLSCVRRTTKLKKKGRLTTERILWQEEKWYGADLPQPEAGVTRLPVFFPLPAGLPESTAGEGDGVQWRLEVSAKVGGPDFQSCFEVPVFSPAGPPQLAGEVPAAAAATDPTLAYQLTLDEVRKRIRSRIEVREQPDGREFVFPAGRNPGFASAALVLWLVWTGAIGLMLLARAPMLFPLIFMAVDALMGIFLADLWFRRSCVVVTPGQLKMQTSWLGYAKETVLAAGELASLKADIGATAGNAAYYDLKVRARNGREYLAAKFLNHKPEAEWLIRQMAAVLKRPPAPAEADEQG